MPRWVTSQGVESPGVEEAEWDKRFSLFFSLLCLQAGKGKRAASCYQTTSAPRDGKQSFDNALETSMQGRVFQGCYLSDFDSSEMPSASWHQD